MNFNEHISKVLLNEFAGSEKKMTVILDDGQKYLLKMPDRSREANNSVSEYLGCKIMKQLGIPVQEVILGEYTDKRGETKIACACQDVRKTGEQMYEIQKLNLSSPDPEESSIANAMKFADKLERLSDGAVTRDEIVDFYYDMFVGDALIGNTGRDNGNWAVLSGPNGLRISPVYDCGSSLSPLLNNTQLSKGMMEREAMTVGSAIIGEDGHRIRYNEYIASCKNEDLNNALKRVVPKINITEIGKLIDSTPYISDTRKNFYKKLISTRYEKVLLPSLKRLNIRDKGAIDELAKGFNGNELKQIGASIVSDLSKMPVNMSLMIRAKSCSVVLQKVTKKDVLVYDGDGELSGVASVSKDFQQVKALLYELQNAGLDIGDRLVEHYMCSRLGNAFQDISSFSGYDVINKNSEICLRLALREDRMGYLRDAAIYYGMSTGDVWAEANGGVVSQFEMLLTLPTSKDGGFLLPQQPPGARNPRSCAVSTGFFKEEACPACLCVWNGDYAAFVFRFQYIWMLLPFSSCLCPRPASMEDGTTVVLPSTKAVCQKARTLRGESHLFPAQSFVCLSLISPWLKPGVLRSY